MVAADRLNPMSKDITSHKLYAYVDESGLETEGRLFIVAIAVINGNPQNAIKLCEEIETISGKGKVKWGKAKHAQRMDYLRRVFSAPELRGRVCYAIFRGTKDFDTSTIEGITLAIHHFAIAPKYSATIYIDALSKSKRHEYGARLRKAGIQTHKVQGIGKDESNALIRLTDAIAGFVRDAIDGGSIEIVDLFKQAGKTNALIEI